MAGRRARPDGLAGAVRLGLRRELEVIEDDAEREACVRKLIAAAHANAKAINAAALFELDDVIGPTETRAVVLATLASAAAGPPPDRPRFVDTW